MKQENIVLALLITVIICLYVNKNDIINNITNTPLKIFFIIILILLFRFNPMYGCIGLLFIIGFYKSIGLYNMPVHSKYTTFYYDKSIIKQPYKYTAVIVEPREHKALEFVLKNFMENLDENWGFVIFHGTKNETYLKNIINNSLEKYKPQITLVNLGISNLTIADYSMLFYDPNFYSYIPSEMFLIFQTDSIILKENRDKIYDFMEYDYVGAPFIPFVPFSKNIKNIYQIGNGGLSLRRKSKMLQMLKYKKKAITSDNRYGKYIGEDLFFCNYNINGTNIVSNVKIYKPNVNNAKQFCMQNLYDDNPFGVHQYWLLKQNLLNKAIKKYPDLRTLMILNDKM